MTFHNLVKMEGDTSSGAVREMFALYDSKRRGELSPLQVQMAHEAIRIGGLSLPQVHASMEYVCVDPSVCEEWEFLDLLKEMDRRYFLVQDLRWEFSLLDNCLSDTITEDQARWFLQAVHGTNFSQKRFNSFLKSRCAPGTGVSFAEIEVELCNIPSCLDILKEKEEDDNLKRDKAARRSAQEEESRRLREKLEAERLRMIEEKTRKEEVLKQKALEEKQRQEQERMRQEEELRLQEEKKREEEELRRRQEERERNRLEREAEEHRKREEERRLEKLREEAEARRLQAEEEAKNIEATAKLAEEEELEAARAAKEAADKLKRSDDAKSRKEFEEMEAAAKRKQAEMREKKIRANLKVAIKTEKKPLLKQGVDDFKKAKLVDHDQDLPKADRLLKLADAREGLEKGMASRKIPELEAAMNNVRKNSFESDLQPEMIEANQMLLRLKRLERIRAEILELKQSTVAEIRSYSSPPPIVHSVMIATFLILGHAEKETREWKKVQALVGKTGKEGLKRRCLEYEPSTLAKNMPVCKAAQTILAGFELDDVRDVSAGAATFYLWATNMVEEADLIEVQRNKDKQNKA